MSRYHLEKKGLVLRRKLGQAISIEHGLLDIYVVGFSGKQVILKIIGNCRVDRKEILTPDEGGYSDASREETIEIEEETNQGADELSPMEGVE